MGRQSAQESAPAKSTINVCVFKVCSRHYCIPADSVEYIYPSCELTPLPHPLASVQGVFNLRGSAIPVIDMGFKCEKTHLPIEPEHKFIIMKVSGHTLALHVEDVPDVIAVDASAYHDAAQMLPGLHVLSGIVQYQDGLALVYDPEHFFQEELEETGHKAKGKKAARDRT
jgi:purine-binding chemotaxis protein CheW